jgi:hypothetical protein
MMSPRGCGGRGAAAEGGGEAGARASDAARWGGNGAAAGAALAGSDAAELVTVTMGEALGSVVGVLEDDARAARSAAGRDGATTGAGGGEGRSASAIQSPTLPNRIDATTTRQKARTASRSILGRDDSGAASTGSGSSGSSGSSGASYQGSKGSGGVETNGSVGP